ncbi:MAG TPA: hypothetical protein VGN17_22360 [Bryobacteraceae bacterium]|jgi:hypothetical protein
MTTRIVCLLWFSTLLAAAESQPVEVTSTERMELGPGGVIRLNTATGNLFIDGWDRPEMEITTIKVTRASYETSQKDDAMRCLDSVHVSTARRSSSEVELTDAVPSRKLFSKIFGLGCGVRVDHRIQVPRDAKLVIRHDAGYVEVSHVAGDIEATSKSSDLMLMLPGPGPYSIDAKTKFGGVISDFAGASDHVKIVGEEFTGTRPAPAHRIYLRIGFGAITIKELPPNAEPPLPSNGPGQ